jgi:hypothetical protein
MLRYGKNKTKEAAYMKQYEKDNRKQLNEYHRNWRKNRQTDEQKRKECEAAKKWRGNNRGKVLAMVTRWQIKNPEKAVAHAALNMAIKVGLVARPDACSKCGKKCKPHAHHTDYSKMLEVVWLCPLCHKQFHLSEKTI